MERLFGHLKMSLSLHLKSPIVTSQLDGNKDVRMTSEAPEKLRVVPALCLEVDFILGNLCG